jgi:hypothetical protein
VASPVEGAESLRLDVWGGCRKSGLLAALLKAEVEIVEAGGAAGEGSEGGEAAAATATGPAARPDET